MKPILTAAFVLAATSAAADVCDFRPSIMAGKAGAAAKNTASDVATGVTNSVKAIGAYTLNNPVSGISMLSSGMGTATAAGTSLGTAASGALGTAATVVTAPVTLSIAGATAVALGGFEGVCHFRKERITDYDEILYIVTNLAANSDPTMFKVIPEGTEYYNLKGNPAVAGKSMIRVAGPGYGPDLYDIEKLYVVDGVLKHKDALRDTVIGEVALQVVEVDEETAPAAE
ncbi:hypothetical protein [Psychromarinibacter halotolerans]|uniref:Uncharacterized protein n=1 Tax=Psychromarinibacter halotolerans TaxID=1775175 RepID=A0ABV7GU18_9RHOB|nr:hypothetical protein [Psychromarinibacter halotolerans]MAQ86573.1 hypothetical protein [Maritimibacter sp.]MAS53015.1 hypothetical protein [Pimelobacter sp.]MDF0598316.1 hypothetical protein [Psychromarinibacter halotolerans]